MDLKIPSAVPASSASAKQATNKHLRGSSLLLVGRIIAMGTNFVVQVLIVRYLSKSDYGAFAYVMSLVSLASSLAVFGMDKTVTRFLPMYQEKGEHSKLYGTMIIVVATILSLSFFLVVLVFGLQGWLAENFIDDQQAAKLLLLIVLLVPIHALDSLLVGMLAIFGKPSMIFFRRHILGPGLKLLVVLLLVFLGGSVYFLSAGFVVAGALGVAIYSGILISDLRNQGLWKQFSAHKPVFPVKEIFSFSTPLFTTNLVYVIRSQLIVMFLAYFHNTRDVAAYRAVQPVADLNTVVIQSFGLLFIPTLARLFAKEDHKGVNDLYWHSAIWIAVITFPIFLITFALAQPVTVLLFGQRYAQSGVILALLAFGYYFNAALGFNSDTLRVYGNIRYTVVIDIVAMLVSVALCLVLIPLYGAFGAAIATCATLVLYNILNHLGLKLTTNINLFNFKYIRVYISIVLGTLALLAFQELTSFSIYVDLVIAGLISLVVLLLNRKLLKIEETFPELLRFPIVRLIFKPIPGKTGLSNE